MINIPNTANLSSLMVYQVLRHEDGKIRRAVRLGSRVGQKSSRSTSQFIII